MSDSLSVTCIIVGDTKVGKSCLLVQLMDYRLKQEYDITVGAEFRTLPFKFDHMLTNIQIWDTAGHERFRMITRAHLKNAAVAFIVFDATDRDSFESLNLWLNEVKTYGNNDIIVLLVANKVDLVKERRVSTDEGLKFANQYSLIYVETSAMDKNSVERIFLTFNSFFLLENERWNYKNSIFIPLDNMSMVHSIINIVYLCLIC